MAFADTLSPASFRGVPFGVFDNSGEFGRRGQLHEYPARDIPYSEDLGRRARHIAFRGFVIGDDCALQRDLLIAALEQKGPGLLVHPSAQPMLMQPDPARACRYTERWDHGRVVEFDLAFVEPGRMIYPQAAADTQANSQTAADGVTAAADQDLATGTGTPDINETGDTSIPSSTPEPSVTIQSVTIVNSDATPADIGTTGDTAIASSPGPSSASIAAAGSPLVGNPLPGDGAPFIPVVPGL